MRLPAPADMSVKVGRMGGGDESGRYTIGGDRGLGKKSLPVSLAMLAASASGSGNKALRRFILLAYAIAGLVVKWKSSGS